MKMLRSGLKKPTAAKFTTHTPSTEPIERVDSPIPCASHEDSCFKENISVNKCEPPKLNVEPLQMKRRKNDGGCNLRKSLAWDRAFLTEEGVLDPLELSIISGSPFREGLPIINEDTRGSLQLKSTDCRELKDKLSRKSPDEHLGKDRRKYCLPQRLDSSSPNIMYSHKVKTCVASKSSPRCSGSPPPPLQLSSLKRPATVKTEKTASKGVKLQKVPCSRTGPSPVRSTSKSNIPRAKCVNNHKIAVPDFSIQRNAGPRSFPKGFKTPQTTLKASSLWSTYHSETDLGTLSSKRHSSVNMSQAPVDKADENSGSKIISDTMTTCKPKHSLEGEDETLTSVVGLAQNARNSDRTKYPSQNQSTKPSGLRMPSPSLSFFSQPKASAGHDLSLRDTPTAIWWSQEPSSRTVEKDNKIPNSTSSSDGMVISSISGCLVPSHIHDASHRTAELNLEKNSTQMMEMKVSDDAMSSDQRGYKLVEDYALQIQDLPKSRAERVLPENAEMLKEVGEMPSQSGSCEHVIDDWNLKGDSYPVKGELGGSESRNAGFVSEHYAVNGYETNNATEEWTTCNSLVLTDGAVRGPQCKEVINLSEQNLLVMKEQAHKSNFLDTNIPHEDEYILRTKVRESEILGESHQYISWCGESANFEGEMHCQANTKHQLSGSVIDTVPVMEDHGGNNCSPLEEGGSDTYSQSGKEEETVLVLSPDISHLKQLECVELLDAGTASESLSPSNDGLQFENPLQRESSRRRHLPNLTRIEVDEGTSTSIDELQPKFYHCEDNNVYGNIDGYFTGQELHVDILRKSSVSEQEPHHERCSAADGNGTGADSSRIRRLPDPTRIEVDEDTSSSIDELQPKLDHVHKSTLASTMHCIALHESSECGGGLNDKRTLVIPQNAVPFSDEWLAAMEAAGEDILTKKSGAVQNSPTDKSLPDPSPWSPVKRKNNQIGPYDCTKFTNIMGSDSN